jgi:2-dehydro-3-deoxyphosphogluconate aldolase/(4S)-4-hydroxy-2-oxoglutarate aldolase
MSALSQILKGKIVAIIRGAKPGDVLNIADALRQGGVNILEVTLNSPGALSIIKELADKKSDTILIGAGTVLDASMAMAAIDAGAKFIISPNTNIETIEVTNRYGVISIPGAYTATEVVHAHTNGGDIIKIFPASSPKYIQELRGPLSHIPMMPTGGITLENIHEFHQAGAVAFGIGTSLVDTKQKITDEYLMQITTVARKFVQAIAKIDE